MSRVEETEKLPRRHDLDWLRVLVIVFVFVYHVGLIFQGNWIISNDETSKLVGPALGLSAFVRMPVLFL
jgi:glucans biosynthesis protein C